MPKNESYSDRNCSKSGLPENILQKLYPNSDLVQTNRGPELKSGIKARYSALIERENHVCWGGNAIASEVLNLNFLVAGVPGTGKTVTIRRLLHSVFSDRLKGQNRAVLYDPKNEFYPILRGYGLAARKTYILNPFDDRGSAWDLAADFTSSADAMQLASTIIPESRNANNPFFRNSAVAILAAVIESLIVHYPSKWTLANVIQVCLKLDAVKSFLQSNMSAFSITANNLLSGDPQTSLNVFSELQSHLLELIPIAALWRHSFKDQRVFSLKSFCDDSDTAVILGASQQFEKPLMMLNRLVVKRMSELILDKPPASKATEIYNRTWVILDELRQIGKIEGLGRFVTMGRDRGVCAVFGFQDYPGLIDSLGKEVAHELVSCCRHKLFLRLDNESAEWASKVLGKQEVTRQNITSQQGMGFGVSLGSSESFGGGNSQTRTTGWSSGSSSGPNGGSSSSSVFSSNSDTESSNWSYGNNKGANANISSSISVSHEVRERDVVLASQIANLPYFSEGRGIHGYTSDGGDGSALPTVYRIHVPIEECVAYMSKSSDEGFVAADPRKQDLFAELD